jgi:hypothetical protein
VLRHPTAALSEADVEFSDEVFLLTTEEAKRHIEPPRPARLEVKPASTRVKPGEKLALGVQCFDQHGRDYPCPSVNWSASGGKVDEKGLYVAKATPAYYTVTASIGSLEARAEIEVASVDVAPPPPARHRRRSVARRGPPAEMDELLHQGPLAVRRGQGAEA